MIARCDDCARAAGVADSYHDGAAELDAAAWLVGAMRRGYAAPPKPADVAEVFDALWGSESGRVALAAAVRAKGPRVRPPG